MYFLFFFSKIKDQVGQINAQVFMPDDAPAYYNAWERIMGSVPNTSVLLACYKNLDGKSVKDQIF